MRREMKRTTTVLKTNSLTTCSDSQLINRFDQYSSWDASKRAAANCQRLKAKMLRATKTINRRLDLTHVMLKTNTLLTVQDLAEGEKAIIREVQSRAFQKEIQILKELKLVGNPQSRNQLKGRNIQFRKSSTIYKLSLFIDDQGLLRVGGRIQKSCQPFEIKHPVILPKNIVRHFHEQINHMGRDCTHNYIRQHGYWIISGSYTVSKLINQCVMCRKFRRAPQTQKMGDLPCDHIKEALPFTYSGVDLFGPFLIKERRSQLKRYGVVFVCMASKAIHLETVNSLDTNSVINAMRRFVSIRGPIRQLRADCGSNIVGTHNEMIKSLKEIDQKKMADFLLGQRCDWIEFKFNVPSSSHMRGIWERQIRTVRSILEPLIYQAGPQREDESFRTFMAKVQNIINSRPITLNQLSESYSPEPLTPNHLLMMKTRILLPSPGNFQKADMYSTRRWRRVQHLSNEFWNRWRKEFLHTLQQRPKWTAPQCNLKLGDIVIIKKDNVPGNFCRLGRVTAVYPGKDGLVCKYSLLLPVP
ncbi:uncharacterized protein LOC102803130 [Saccoglossus kowalevskii]|uniref:Uncharacterized protein LOC102803130 n=1 Tax=Saccoglossus kowalevskii TaxID=10224 RepID=A0ABM0MST4_SACKO|nr:PREDICTED: uncharacterized protein LOC102803130 [Saccoglossus kowalevskii]